MSSVGEAKYKCIMSDVKVCGYLQCGANWCNFNVIGTTVRTTCGFRTIVS